MTPVFSIVIPVYNVALYIRECLDSVLVQTFPGWEAICVDDGSTDGSGEILDEYAAKDKRFRVIHQQNSGVSAARNSALAIIQGDWIYNVDADDVIAQDMLARYAELIERHSNVDAFLFPDTLPYEDGAVDRVAKGSMMVEVVSDHPIKGGKLLATTGVSGHSVLRLLRRKIFGEIYFPLNVGMMEDALHLIDVLSTQAVWAKADVKGYYYRRRENSASHIKTPKRCEEVMHVFKRIIDSCITKLDFGMADLKRFVKASSSVIELYLRGAMVGEDDALACRCAAIYFEIEAISRSKVLSYFCRGEALSILWRGEKGLCYVVLHAVEYLYLGIRARVRRLANSLLSL